MSTIPRPSRLSSQPRRLRPKPIVVAASLVIAAASAGLAGCGQKSALYLPGHNPNPPKPMGQPAKDSNRGGKNPNTANPDRADVSGADQADN